MNASSAVRHAGRTGAGCLILAFLCPALSAQDPDHNNVVAELKIGANGQDQNVHIANHSGVTIIITSIVLSECENVRGSCGVRRLKTRLVPGAQALVTRIQPRYDDQSFNFRYTYTFTTETATSQASPAPAPDRPAPVSTAIVDSIENPEIQKKLREAIKEDSSAASKIVDSVDVVPGTLTVRVGESLKLTEALRVIAYDLDGNPVQGFRARIYLEVGREFAEIAGGGLLRGIKPGSAVLVVAPPSPPGAQGDPNGTARVLIRVVH